MKQIKARIIVAIIGSGFGLGACGGSTPEGSGGASGSGGLAGSGGTQGSGGAMGTGGAMGKGGVSGGPLGTGGKAGTGGRSSSGGATGSGTATSRCPYTVASFSCEAACSKLHDFYARCKNDPTLPEEAKAMLGLYGEVVVICTNSCAVVAPSAQAEWSCYQGMPDDAPCSAIAGCNATNCL
jgi:hypothetical protein